MTKLQIPLKDQDPMTNGPQNGFRLRRLTEAVSALMSRYGLNDLSRNDFWSLKLGHSLGFGHLVIGHSSKNKKASEGDSPARPANRRRRTLEASRSSGRRRFECVKDAAQGPHDLLAFVPRPTRDRDAGIRVLQSHDPRCRRGSPSRAHAAFDPKTSRRDRLRRTPRRQTPANARLPRPTVVACFQDTS